MSPLSLRRYRAERLLREEFDQLKGRVMAVVRGRLRARGVHLDGSDLEACYAQAWHGLYAAMLDGQNIANPTGWLTLVTFRRAIEEHRARGLSDCNGSERLAEERDLAATLDDRLRLRQLFEALRGRLSERELQAAALCYLQGLSRSEAAARMRVSETRMRKLMEGCGPSRPGVAGKVGALVETIRGGGWCEEQGSLMRGLAYGILDPEGERYRLAMIHRSECPACRAYVLSLRGLAALLPPVPALMHWGMHAGAAAGTGAAAAAGTGGGRRIVRECAWRSWAWHLRWDGRPGRHRCARAGRLQCRRRRVRVRRRGRRSRRRELAAGRGAGGREAGGRVPAGARDRGRLCRAHRPF